MSKIPCRRFWRQRVPNPGPADLNRTLYQLRHARVHNQHLNFISLKAKSWGVQSEFTKLWLKNAMCSEVYRTRMSRSSGCLEVGHWTYLSRDLLHPHTCPSQPHSSTWATVGKCTSNTCNSNFAQSRIRNSKDRCRRNFAFEIIALTRKTCSWPFSSHLKSCGIFPHAGPRPPRESYVRSSFQLPRASVFAVKIHPVSSSMPPVQERLRFVWDVCSYQL